MSKPPLTSRFILGARPAPETADKLRADMDLGPDAQLNPSVLEVEVGGKLRYCCWSGGAFPRTPEGHSVARPEDVQFTLAGQAAVEALLALPFLPHKVLIFQEMRLGQTPLRDKVLAAFERSADVEAVVVFVGDLAKELDGHMATTFNLSGFVELDDIIARQPKH
jgi:hypothetical protein